MTTPPGGTPGETLKRSLTNSIAWRSFGMSTHDEVNITGLIHLTLTRRLGDAPMAMHV